MITTCEDCGDVIELSREAYQVLIQNMSRGGDNRWRCSDCWLEYLQREHEERIDQGDAIGEGEIG